MKSFILFLVVLVCFAPARLFADQIYGVKSYGTGQINSAPPAHLFRFEPGNSSVTDLGAITIGSPIDVDALAISPDGLFGFNLSGGNSTLISIDPTTAHAVNIGSPLASRNIRGAAFDTTGQLWVVDANANELLKIDHSTGNVVGSAIGLEIGVSDAMDIAVDANGQFTLASVRTFYQLSPLTGQMTQLSVGNSPGMDGYLTTQVGLGIDPESPGSLFSLDILEHDDIFRYDANNGFARTQPHGNILFSFNSGRGDLASGFSAVPEPGSFWLLALITILWPLLVRCSRRKVTVKQNSNRKRDRARHQVIIASTTMATILILLFTGTPISGQTFNWLNTSSTSAQWQRSGNWAPLGGPPGSTETAQFQQNQIYEVWFDAGSGNPTIGNLLITAGDIEFLNQTSTTKSLTVKGINSFSDLSISGANTELTLDEMHLRSTGGAEILSGSKLTLDGTGSMLTVSGGIGMDVSGDLSLITGGKAIGSSTYIGRNGGSSGTIQVVGAGSEFETTSLFAGYSGTGSVTVQAGGKVTSSFGYIGRFSGSTGSVLVSNLGEWSNSSILSVGNSGTGSLTIEGSGNVSNSTGYIGRLAGSIGTADVESAGSWSSSNLYIAGSNSTAGGTGTLNISGTDSLVSVIGTTRLWSGGTINLNGGSLTTGSFDNSNGGNLNFHDGTLTVNGVGGSFDPGTGDYKIDGNTLSARPTLVIDGAVANIGGPSSDFTIGRSLKGGLTISSGGTVTNGSAVIGDISGSDGTVTVTGTGSHWSNLGYLYVGDFGHGSLTIKSGGVVSNTNGRIGGAIFSNSEVTVKNPGSQWNNSSSLVVHDGTLNIESGGVVTSDGGSIANSIEHIGVVSVIGIGSTWSNSGDLNIGGLGLFDGGTATLNIDSKGLVSVAGRTKIYTPGNVNIDGGRFEFGETTIPEFNKINAVIGSMAGNLLHSAYTNVNTLATLHQSNDFFDIREVLIANSGTLYGDTSFEIGLNNLVDGDVETVAGERMRFGGLGNNNAGEINNFGGLVRFDQDMTNQAGGFIGGRGQFIANAGWTNHGVMAFSGGSTEVLGDIENDSGGQIVTTGSQTTTFFDDVVHNGTEIRTAANSRSVFFGAVSGAGDFTGSGTTYFEGDLRPGNSPDIVDFEGNVIMGTLSVLQVEIGGESIGEFDQLNISGDLFLQGELQVDLIDGFGLSANQEFLVANVDGTLSGQFNGFGEGDVVGTFAGRELYISYQAGDGNDIAMFTSAVPEPCTCGLLTFAAMIFVKRRRNKAVRNHHGNRRNMISC